jgi:hypothetical protein
VTFLLGAITGSTLGILLAALFLGSSRSQEIDRWRKVMRIFAWLLGLGGGFPTRPEGAGAYYWRIPLVKRLEAVGISYKDIEAIAKVWMAEAMGQVKVIERPVEPTEQEPPSC